MSIRKISLLIIIFILTPLRAEDLQALLEKGKQKSASQDFQGAFQIFQTGLEEATRKKEKDFISEFTRNTGNVYLSLGNLTQALSYYEKSLELDRKLKNKNKEARSLNNIGLVYLEKGDHPKALSYLQDALKLFRREE